MSRTDDANIEAVEQALTDALPLTMAINAWEGRWPLNTYADIDASKLSQAARDRLKTAEVDDAEGVRRIAEAARAPCARPMRRPRRTTTR